MKTRGSENKFTTILLIINHWVILQVQKTLESLKKCTVNFSLIMNVSFSCNCEWSTRLSYFFLFKDVQKSKQSRLNCALQQGTLHFSPLPGTWGKLYKISNNLNQNLKILPLLTSRTSKISIKLNLGAESRVGFVRQFC